jgi:hypothetical protein
LHGGLEICADCSPSYRARYGQPYVGNFSPFRSVQIRAGDGHVQYTVPS